MSAREASSRPGVIAIAAIVGVAGFVSTIAVDAEETVDALIQRVVAETTRSGIAVRATRRLEAGAASGKYHAWMSVETTLTANNLSWRVLDEGGSERTREKVLRAVLETEAESVRTGSERAALSPANYEFVPLGTTGGQTRLQLKARRADPTLINGTLTVGPDGQPLLLEGQLAKSPSFWVKSVTVVRHYARVGGVSLPTAVESLAEIRMVGRSSFSMQYEYTAVNGKPVGWRAATPPRLGVSAAVLALHGQQP